MHSLNSGHATHNAMIVFLAFCNAGATGLIAGVNLSNVRTKVVVMISSSSQMLWQIPHLTYHNSDVEVKYLENILLVSTPPHKPCLASCGSRRSYPRGKYPTLHTTSSSSPPLHANRVLHLAEADVATLAKLRSTDLVLVARSSSLRLTYTNYLNMRPNDVAIHKCTTRLHDVHGGDEGVILCTRLP